MLKKKLSRLITAVSAAALLLCGCNGGTGDTTTAATVSPSEGTGNVGSVTLEAGDTYAVISVKDYGDITVKLYPELAPVGVKQFTDLANDGYYNGKNFHRIMAGFMFQGGSLNGDGARGLPDGYSEFGVEYNYNMRHFYGALCFANAGGMNAAQFYIVNNKTSVDATKYTAELWRSNKTQAESNVEQAKAMGAGYEAYVTYYEAQVTMFTKMAEYAENRSDAVIQQYAEQGGTPSLDGGYTVFGQTVDGFDVIDAISAVEVTVSATGEQSLPVTEVLIDTVKIYTK